MTKSLPLLNSKRVALVDDEDYERLAQYRWTLIKPGGRDYIVHWTSRDGGKKRTSIPLHRLVLGLSSGDGNVIHVNGDALDNRRSNLCFRAKPTVPQNQEPPEPEKGFIGVTWRDQGRKWIARYKHGRHDITIGEYASQDEAARRRDLAAWALSEGRAELNFPDPLHRLLAAPVGVPGDIETKEAPASRVAPPVKLKLAPDALTDEGTFEGYASVFEAGPDAYGDVIAKGAFAESLREQKPLMLWSHDPAEPIGVWLSVEEDAHGLRVKGRLVLETARGREAHALLKAGALNGLSIGFRVKASEKLPGGVRRLTEIELIEISVVSIPADAGARIVGVKGAAGPRHSGKLKQELKMEDDQLEETGLGARVDTLEESVAGIDERLGKVEETVSATQKAANRIEQKLNRPGGARVDVNNGDDAKAIERKAFSVFIKRGENALEADERKSLRVSDDTAGGYLAPEQFAAEMIKNLVEFSPVRSVARVANTSSGSVILPKRTSGPTAYWVGETESRTSTESAYGQAEFPVCELAAYVDVSNQLLEDAAFDIAAELSRDLAEEFGQAEGTAFVSGSGQKTPTGFLSAGISTVANGHATTLKVDGIIDTFHGLPSAYAANAVWGMNRSTMGAVRKLKDTDGNYLWRSSLIEGNPATIFGRPVIELPDMPDIGSTETPIVFGDFKNFRIFDRLALSVLRDPFTQQTAGNVRFHARRRVAGGVSKAEAFRLLKMTT